jgi:hypothetical protein
MSGWLSDSTASQILGYDYSEEVRKQKQVDEQAKQVGNPLLGIKPEDAEAEDDEEDMDREMEDLLKGLTPEQRQAVLNAKNAEDMQDAILKAKAPSGNGQNQETPPVQPVQEE